MPLLGLNLRRALMVAAMIGAPWSVPPSRPAGNGTMPTLKMFGLRAQVTF